MTGRFFSALACASLAMSADAALASTNPPRLAAGTYEGSYVCAQGVTRLRLIAARAVGDRQTARFEFGGNDGLPTGVYTVRVRTERNGTIVLTPLSWLSRPADYLMVGARLNQQGATLVGTITNPDCGEVSITRTD